MPVFPLLAQPEAYRACDWDFLVDEEGRRYYIDLFETMSETVARAALASGYPASSVDAARRELLDELRQTRARPDRHAGVLNILTLDALQNDVLRRHAIDDPYRALKERETAGAVRLLPDRFADIDSRPRAQRSEAIIRGVFAGNIFDMGAKATADHFMGDSPPDFATFLEQVPDRPWLFDHVGSLRFHGRGKAVVFVDNAGADVVLGMLPLIRELLGGGAEVVVAANGAPAWNDITIDELNELIALIPVLDRAREQGALRLVDSGNDQPLIDLSDVSPELCDAARSADLLVLEGMGRALESNWDAAFTCETWRLATIKDPQIARRKGGRLFDCVCRVDAPG